jgi:hypothetical protein
MARSQLTPKQKRLVKELDELTDLFDLDYWNIESYDKDGRTYYLEAMRSKFVRSQVIIWYTLIDEFLNLRLSRFFYGPKRPTIKLWRTKRYKVFNYHVLEELSLLQKLRFARAIKAIPKAVVGRIERFNALRNGIAHSFFPENLKKSPPVWNGLKIFSLDGAKALAQDIQAVIDFFVEEG